MPIPSVFNCCYCHRGVLSILWFFRSSQNLPHVLNGYDGMIFLQCIWVNYLVGGIPTPMKNMKVSWDYYSQYMEKCSKPPTSIWFHMRPAHIHFCLDNFCRLKIPVPPSCETFTQWRLDLLEGHSWGRHWTCPIYWDRDVSDISW